MKDWPAPEHARAAAQLEATMRVFDALEDLRRDVEALRHEIPTRRAPVPVATIARVAAEAGILVAVAVVAGVGQFRPLLTVVLMAAALVSVIASEWLAARSAYVPRSFGFTFAQPPPVVVYDPPPETPLETDPWERGWAVDPEPIRS
jgi:hypothetical protein